MLDAVLDEARRDAARNSTRAPAIEARFLRERVLAS
jgi:hypothetical protein